VPLVSGISIIVCPLFVFVFARKGSIMKQHDLLIRAGNMFRWLYKV